MGKIECAVNAETVELHSLKCEHIELDIKTPSLLLKDVSSSVEINCNLDMEVVCHSLNGEIALNQVSATSILTILYLVITPLAVLIRHKLVQRAL